MKLLFHNSVSQLCLLRHYLISKYPGYQDLHKVLYRICINALETCESEYGLSFKYIWN